MIAIEDMAAQVQRNCTISDAQYAGNFSVCGLALRLRDLYKWEKGFEPWLEEESSVMLEWIGRKEEEWESLTGGDLADISIEGINYGPFELEKINTHLQPRGFYYGAGFVHGLRPTFFLAPVEETREEEGTAILILGRELARDLMAMPAMTQNDFVLVRRESARLFLWNQLFFVKSSGKEALQFALKAYGVDDRDPASLRRILDRVSSDELETYIHHELGEIRETSFDRTLWRELLTAFPHTPVELLARSLKDILADTGEYGSIRHMIKEKRSSSLGLYVAFLDGIKKEMFPEISPVFKTFTRNGEWSPIQEAAAAAYHRAKRYADAVIGIFQEGKETGDFEKAGHEIERQVLRPLGLAGKA